MPEPDRQPNPEAIAWYAQRAESLLDDLRQRVQSLRTRGGQLAGFAAAVIAIVGANAGAVLESLDGWERSSVGVALLTGSLLLVAAVIVALRGAFLQHVVSDLSAREIRNYTDERFVCEPDLWRVQTRMIKGLSVAIADSTRQGDRMATALAWAGNLFLAGLSVVGIALVILIVNQAF